MKTKLARAISIAADVHMGQFDAHGEPYVLHCLAVLAGVDPDDEELQCIAVLHDSIEDNPEAMAHYDLAKLFSKRVAQGVLDVSRGKDESEDSYYKRVRSNMDAIEVKLADLAHNSDIRRQKGVREKDLKRIFKYHLRYAELKELADAYCV